MSDKDIPNGSATDETRRGNLFTRLFDIRTIIAALLGLYGVLLLIAGFAPGLAGAGAGDHQHSADPIDMSVGSSSNLWVGGVLVLVALFFGAWAALRPHS
ncbi:hypothetical protein P0W64_01625 [Tsukamurella sp. 8F]|uniref:hypothetical protein n=1 Tax=unclassified Tsukamurella TaxID=2633480 RepID=UPI0023B9205B|nr:MULTISPECIES: hypothetical protein [unclassified Tsukamurella]MDF0531062.1 hypothetical protein [Tsukamurella sp. 8J]MDF0585471.1 hypothetical protein [Tsukamurella sp. 8F]